MSMMGEKQDMETNWLQVHGHGNRRTSQEEAKHAVTYRLPMSKDAYEFVCACGQKLSFTHQWTLVQSEERRKEFLAWWSALPTLDEPYDAEEMAKQAEAQKTRQGEILVAMSDKVRRDARDVIVYARDHQIVLADKEKFEALLPTAADPIEELNAALEVGTPPALRVEKVPCFTEYLSDKAKAIYAKQFKQTVIEVCSECGPIERDGSNAMHYAGGDLLAMLGPPEIAPFAKADRKAHDEKATRSVKLCQYLGKTVALNDKGGVDEVWVKRFAKTFNLLAEHEMVNYGVLCEALMIPIAPPTACTDVDRMLSGKPITPEEMKPTRAMLLLYVFSDHERDALNAFLQNVAFTLEGELPSDNWTNLPE